MRYRLLLSFRLGVGRPIGREVDRDTDAQAIDAAQRWLRLIRNANIDVQRTYDRWTVVVMRGGSLPRIVASGGPDDGPSTGEVGS